MTETFTIEHLSALDAEARDSIAQLASDSFGKSLDELTNTDILILLELELQSFPSEVVVNADEVRRTQLQMHTNRTHAAYANGSYYSSRWSRTYP